MDGIGNGSTPRLCPICEEHPLRKVYVTTARTLDGQPIRSERWECPQDGVLPPSGTFTVTRRR